LAQCQRQSINDLIRIDTTTRSDLVDQRIAEDQRPREDRGVWNLLL
jgi:hypothetical protein